VRRATAVIDARSLVLPRPAGFDDGGDEVRIGAEE
jgi:hypothetical protein